MKIQIRLSLNELVIWTYFFWTYIFMWLSGKFGNDSSFNKGNFVLQNRPQDFFKW